MARRVKRNARKSSPDLKSKTETAKNRHISAVTRDEVKLREEERCSYVALDGTRCNSPWNLHLDHIVPHALGGSNESTNLRLRCLEHNFLEAEKVFGKPFMKQFST